jgi:uncharacterized protein (TIGR02598 family)
MIAADARAIVLRGHRSAAFTLVEIILVVAVMATALVAIIGLLPVGMDAARQAANQTVIALIYEDVHNRLQSQPLVPGTASFSPVYFDDRGVLVSPGTGATSNSGTNSANSSSFTNAYYRADVTIGSWNAQPANTSGLLPVTIALSWPVNNSTGQAIGPKNPQSSVTFGAAPLTGTSWPVIDPTYVSKIEF